MSELKKCPFCGGEASFEHRHDDVCGEYVSVACKNCLVETIGYYPDSIGIERARQCAAEDWNRRADGWISVKDRLPENGKLVLALWSNCHCGANNYTVVRYTGANKWKWKACDSFLELTDQDVTHWMPLPEPPKEENNK